jgi:hypothetical protein
MTQARGRMLLGVFLGTGDWGPETPGNDHRHSLDYT